MIHLSQRQRRFVAAYADNPDAKAAALEAGYAPRGARRQGLELLRRPQIMAALADAERHRMDPDALTAATVLRNLADIRNAAAAKGQYSVALRAEELRGRHLGLFSTADRRDPMPLSEMNEEEILFSLGLSRDQTAVMISK